VPREVERSMGRTIETDNKLDVAPVVVTANVVGLTGDLALQALGRRAKKRANEERKKEEEEAKALMERILKAKQD
jgi:membrane protein DedA with SNARE-associated domain